MQFIVNHYLLILFSIIFSLCLHYFKEFLIGVNEKLSKQIMRYKLIILLLFIIFYVFFYFSRPVYYTGYVGGTIGDNYNYVHHGIANPNYRTTQHLFFPFIPARCFNFLTKIGLYSESDNDYLEKAFLFFSLPNRCFALIGIFIFFHILRLVGLSQVEQIVGTAFFSTTFGYWFWVIQSNAMGFLLTMEIIAVYMVILALKSDRTFLFILSSLVTSLCVYTHISSVYSVFSLGISVAIICIYNSKKGNTRTPIINLICFSLTALFMGSIFFYFMTQYYQTTKISVMVSRMADYGMFGKFGINLDSLKLLLRDGISTNLTFLLGLIQSGEKSFFENFIIFFQLSCVFLLFISIKDIEWRKMMSFEKNVPIIVIGTTFFTTLFCFSLRKTWPQYYVAITPFLTLLIVILLFSSYRLKKSYNLLLLCFLTVCTFYINGFSKTNVFYGENLNDREIYRVLCKIEKVFPRLNVLYYATSTGYRYNFDSIKAFYRLPGRLSKIIWSDPILLQDIVKKSTNKNIKILLNKTDYPDISYLKNKGFELQKIVIDDVTKNEAYFVSNIHDQN